MPADRAFFRRPDTQDPYSPLKVLKLMSMPDHISSSPFRGYEGSVLQESAFLIRPCLYLSCYGCEVSGPENRNRICVPCRRRQPPIDRDRSAGTARACDKHCRVLNLLLDFLSPAFHHHLPVIPLQLFFVQSHNSPLLLPSKNKRILHCISGKM